MPCTNHPEADLVAYCAGCTKAFCANCLVVLDGKNLCGPCKAKAVRRLERGETSYSYIPAAVVRAPSPWEQEKSLGNLVKTAKAVLFSPNAFFGKLKLYGQGHWLYIALLYWPVAILETVLQWSLSLGMFSTTKEPPRPGILLASCLLVPLLPLLQCAISGSLVHLFLKMTRGAKAELETTFRIYAYAQSAYILIWIPVVGALLSGFWFMVLLTIGLKRMHQTSYSRMIPVLLLCGAMLAHRLWEVLGVVRTML